MLPLHTAHPEKLPPGKLRTIDLLPQSAHSREAGVTAAEALAWMAGEAHTEDPKSICPVLLAVIRFWGHNLSREGRNTLLRPILPLLLNTGYDTQASMSRAGILMAWTLMTNTPAWLEAGGLAKEAVLLRNTRPTDLFKVHKTLEGIIERTGPRSNRLPDPVVSRALLASGHFMPDRYRALQQKASAAALGGALRAKTTGANVTTLVGQLQVNLVKTIMSMPGISPPPAASEHPQSGHPSP